MNLGGRLMAWPCVISLAMALAILSVRSVRACPCADGDLKWSDDDVAQCQLEVARLDGANTAPAASAQEKSARTTSARDSLRKCIGYYRKDHADQQARIDAEIARAKSEAEAARQARAAREEERARADERERAEQAAAEDLRNQRLADPAWMKTVLSAVSCWDDYVKSRSLELIRDEQKYAKTGGGVVDKGKLYELQLHMRHADEDKVDTAAAAKRFHVVVTGCREPAVQKVVACLKDSDSSACSSGNVREMSEFFDVVDGPSWTCRGSNCD